MPLFRREKLHERLARIGGLDASEQSAPADSPLRWKDASIHGVIRPREWDTVVTLLAPDLKGDAFQFVVLDDGTILEEDNPTEQELSVLRGLHARTARAHGEAA